MTPEDSKRQQVVGAVVAFGAALTVFYMVRAHPEGLHAPAMVVYFAAAAFAAAGATLVLQRLGFVRAQIIPALLVCACLGAVSGWIAFGGGPRTCTASVGGAGFLTGGATCRIAFGAGTVLLLVISVLMLRQFFKR